MSPVVLDIETIPDESAFKFIEGKPDKRAKDQEKSKEENRQKQIEKAALDPMYGRVAAYGTAGLGGQHGSLNSDNDTDEGFLVAEVLDTLLGILTDDAILVTFNGMEFDIPFLYKRAMLLNVRAENYPPIGAWLKRYSYRPHFDLYKALSDWSPHSPGSLDFYSKRFGLGSKTERDYSEFPTLIKEGKGREIAKRAEEDAALTMKLYDRVKGFYLPR